MRALVVEDNPRLAAALQSGLRAHGFAADVCHTGFDAEEQAAVLPYDVIILDLMLPDRDGVEVCRNLRRRKIASAVIMLTALNATEQKVSGLYAGADDYLTKPFEFEELLARIHTVLRRGEASDARVLRVADLELDVYTRAARRGACRIALSNREFALLEYLMRHPERVLSRAQIAEKVWDISFEASSNVIDVYIAALRRKVDRGFDPPLIHTVKGAGYRFGVPDAELTS